MDRLRLSFGYPKPLPRVARCCLIVSVTSLHAAILFTFTALPPKKIIVGDVQTMEMRFEQTQPEPPTLQVPQAQLEPLVEPPRPEPPLFEVAQAPLPPDPTASDFTLPVTQPPPPPRPEAKPPQIATLKAVAAKAPKPSPQELPSPRTTGHRIVNEGDLTALEPIKLKYPPSAAAARHWGVAKLRVLIDIDGRPSDVWLTVSTRHSELDVEAIRAIKAARFKPYLEEGRPEPVWVDIQALFILMKK